MADATTTNYKFTKPEVGASADTWGAKLNTDFDSLDKLLGAVATTGSANAYVLTSGQTLTAYATGQSFRVIPNFTNSGACTLNVDAIGAKNIYKNVNGTPTACVSGDIPSGIPITVTYDGTQFIAHGIGLDPTLVALAALSWSSGNALVQFTAADTVSLTLTPSVSKVTATNSAGATQSAGHFTNSVDNAAVTALVFEGDRATPAASDLAYIEGRLSNAAGTQVAFMRIGALVNSGTAGAESGGIYFGTIASGAIADRMLMSSTILRPLSNDGLALGDATHGWSDLFLASGGVLNWNNGNATLTHSSGLLASNVPVQAAMPTSSETSGTLTSASRNKVVVATGGITIDGNVFTAGDMFCIYAGASSRTLTQGSTGSPTQRLNGTATTGNLTLAARGWCSVYVISATEWVVIGAVS